MAGWAPLVGHKACAICVRPGARWLHTCRGPVSSFRRTNDHLRRSSLDSASLSRRCGSLTKSLRMSRRGMSGKRLCTARASRGGAHGRAWVRVRANCRAVQGSLCAHAAVDHRDLLEIDGDGRRTERFFRPFGFGRETKSDFLNLLFWETRCLGSSSRTSNSQSPCSFCCGY